MVLDQLTLLYVPLRIVTDMEVVQGDERVFAMHGLDHAVAEPVDRFRLPRQRRRDDAHVRPRQRRRLVGAELPHRAGQLGLSPRLHRQHLDLVLGEADDVADLLARQRAR